MILSGIPQGNRARAQWFYGNHDVTWPWRLGFDYKLASMMHSYLYQLLNKTNYVWV